MIGTLERIAGIPKNPFGVERERPVFLLLIFLMYIFAHQLKLNTRVDLLGQIRFEFILGLSLILISFYYLFTEKTIKSKKASYSKNTAIFYILYLGLFVIFSFDRSLSWSVYMDRVLTFSLYGLFIVVFVRSPKSLMFFIVVYLLACLRLGYEGFHGWITGSMVWQNQGIMRLHGTTSVLLHPNSFSGFAVGLLPFIYYLFKPSTKYVRIMLVGLLIFSIIIIIYTGSRTGYVATILFVMYLFRNSKNKIKYGVALFLVAIISIPFIPDQYIDRFSTIFTQEEIEGQSMDKRKEIIKDAVEIFKMHPMGVGVGAFPIARDHYFGRNQDTHNLYLEVLTNSGFVGLGIFLILVISIYRLNQHTLKSCLSLRNDGPIALKGEDLIKIEAVVKAVNGYLMVRLILGLFGMDMYEIYWWFILGISIACANYISFCYSSANFSNKNVLKLD